MPGAIVAMLKPLRSEYEGKNKTMVKVWSLTLLSF